MSIDLSVSAGLEKDTHASLAPLGDCFNEWSQEACRSVKHA
jgi:hypothetical protein